MPARVALALINSQFSDILGERTITHMEQSYDGLDFSRPISLVTAEIDDMDATGVDLGCPEHFEIRQVAEDGETHIVLLSRDMVIELVGLMKAWVSIG